MCAFRNTDACSPAAPISPPRPRRRLPHLSPHLQLSCQRATSALPAGRPMPAAMQPARLLCTQRRSHQSPSHTIFSSARSPSRNSSRSRLLPRCSPRLAVRSTASLRRGHRVCSRPAPSQKARDARTLPPLKIMCPARRRRSGTRRQVTCSLSASPLVRLAHRLASPHRPVIRIPQTTSIPPRSSRYLYALVRRSRAVHVQIMTRAF